MSEHDPLLRWCERFAKCLRRMRRKHPQGLQYSKSRFRELVVNQQSDAPDQNQRETEGREVSDNWSTYEGKFRQPTGLEMLMHAMDEQNLTISQMADALGRSNDETMEMLMGKSTITETDAKKLAARFNVKNELFL